MGQEEDPPTFVGNIGTFVRFHELKFLKKKEVVFVSVLVWQKWILFNNLR